jgi:hypothetical protein
MAYRQGRVKHVTHAIEHSVKGDEVRGLRAKTWQGRWVDVGADALDVAEDWAREAIVELHGA